MIKSLVTIGNSKAIILPAATIKKYDLQKVIIEETEEGVLLKSAKQQDSLKKKIQQLKRNKAEISKRIRAQVSHPDTIKYYSDPAFNFSEADVTIL